MAAQEAKPQIGKPVGPSGQSEEDANRAPTFEKLIAMPMSPEGARVRLAECDIQLAQCQKDRAMVEQRVADITWVRAVILRQVLNAPRGGESEGDGNV